MVQFIFLKHKKAGEAGEILGRIHFLWSLAHLTEAIAFNNVVLYDPNGDGPNLTKRSNLLFSIKKKK